MITPTELHACATTNQLLTQLMCQHIVDDQGGVCGQVTFVKQFCEAHADIYEEQCGKMFQISKVKMAYIKDIRDTSIYGNPEDSDIPRFIGMGKRADCNCALELKNNDCIIRAA